MAILGANSRRILCVHQTDDFNIDACQAEAYLQVGGIGRNANANAQDLEINIQLLGFHAIWDLDEDVDFAESLIPLVDKLSIVLKPMTHGIMQLQGSLSNSWRASNGLNEGKALSKDASLRPCGST